MKKIIKIAIIFTLILLCYLNINSKVYASDNGFKITLEKEKYEFTGKQIKPKIKSITYDNNLLKKSDYCIVSYGKNYDVGTGTINLRIKNGPFSKKTLKKSFTIIPKNIANCKVKYKTAFTYTGKEIKPPVSISGVDKKYYTVKYSNNINPSRFPSGSAHIIITGKGNYKGQIKKLFRIDPLNIKNVSFKLSKTKYKYTGEQITPTLSKVQVNTKKYEGKLPTENRDFVIKYYFNVNPGTGEVVIKGINGFTGEVTLKFKIVK